MPEKPGMNNGLKKVPKMDRVYMVCKYECNKLKRITGQ
jgi:hypothetical protein